MLKTVDEMKMYLEFSHYIDGDNLQIQQRAYELKKNAIDEVDLIRSTYYYVRDEIMHSWDIQDKRVTITASDVIREKVGICWAKSNLLAALLRVNSIPAGICYQRLTLGDTPESGYCIHALNAVYVKTVDKWIRLDARGNKIGVEAEFSLDKELLAFSIRSAYDEIDYEEIYAEPLPKLMKVLESNTDALDMYLNLLPERI